MREKRIDMYIGIGLFLFSMFLWFYLIPIGIPNDEAITGTSPKLFPKFAAVCLAILSIFLVIKTFVIHDENDDEEKEEKVEGSRGWVAYVIIGIMVLYTIVVQYIGFIITTIASMFIVMYLLSVRKWYQYFIVVVIIFFFQYFFGKILNIQLP